MSDDNKNTQSNKLTLEKVIKFYMSRQEHYPISDLFMMNYRQKGTGYIAVYSIFTNQKHNGVEDNKHFYELIKCFIDKKNHAAWKPDDDYGEQLEKNLNIFNSMKKEEMLCHCEQTEYNELEPNQKWHFLVSWCAYKLLVKNDKKEFLDGIATKASPFGYGMNEKPVKWVGTKTIIKKESKITIQEHEILCPELRLWMYEAAFDGEIITKDLIMKVYSEAVNLRLKIKKIKDEKAFWDKRWNEIAEVITNWQG